jgi:hypothetical protein
MTAQQRRHRNTGLLGDLNPNRPAGLLLNDEVPPVNGRSGSIQLRRDQCR